MAETANRRTILARLAAATGTLALAGCTDLSQQPWVLNLLGEVENLTRRAQSELLAAGGRRRADLLGGAALTASELRVAQLAASGASNAEIAQSLFVSLKTVETHLAHTYAKFGLAGAGSRRRLAGLLEAHSQRSAL